jgi:tol-pal system protein YbgF
MVVTGRWHGIAAALVAMLGAAAPALAQQNELRILVPRLERVEAELNDLQRRLARGGSGGAAPVQSLPADSSTGAIVRLDDRISMLERQLAELTGKIEETGHRVDQVRQRMDKAITDIEFRLQQIEQGGGAAAAGAAGGAAALAAREQREQQATRDSGREQGREQAPQLRPPPGATAAAVPPATPSPPRSGPVLPEGSPMDRYNFAIGLLARQDYPAAETAFREFVSAHPGDRLAGNAQYWLGETYYVRNDMTKAAQTFLEGVKKYPDGPKAADTMLKLGMALTAINQKAEACGVFGELKNRFPNLSRDTATGLAAARERAACR